jgi:hypothetical protein
VLPHKISHTAYKVFAVVLMKIELFLDMMPIRRYRVSGVAEEYAVYIIRV